MILIRPKHEILTDIDGDKVLQRIEAAGRTCYKSEEKITAESAEPFVRRIIMALALIWFGYGIWEWIAR